jgi:TrmH family RNA methyltransferase
MMNLRKLQSLTPGTRRRKIALLLQSMEREILEGHLPDRIYLRGFLQVAAAENDFPENLKARAAAVREMVPDSGDREILFALHELRLMVLAFLGAEPADWDFPEGGYAGTADTGRKERMVRPWRLYLDGLRSPFNVGSLFRTAESFGIEKIFVSEGTASPLHRRSLRAAMSCIDRIPWEVAPLEAVPGPFFALECGGTSVGQFDFPETGTLIIGSEELGVSPGAMKKAESGLGRVTIPTYGLKGSLNVSVAFGIVMSAWCGRFISDGPKSPCHNPA